MANVPRLDPGNAAVRKLEVWLEAKLEEARTKCEAAQSWDETLRWQGRARFIRELLKTIDPEHKTLDDD